MKPVTTLAAFTLGIATVFATAYGAGRVVDPVVATADDQGHVGGGHGTGHDAGPGRSDPAAPHPPGGLVVSERGYTLATVAARPGEFAFRILGPDARPVSAYDVAHDRRMHLIVVRRDLSGFGHVHPVLGADGTWRVATPFGQAGSWRAFADFTPTGAEPLTLGVDVAVPGTFAPRPLPAPSTVTTVDGYTVRLGGGLAAGRTNRLELHVSRAGRPVTDLAPYLGAYGHLVVLRAGDLAYLHVHPDGAPGDGSTAPGPEIRFSAEVPSAGSYRIFLDFQHAGAVHTAEFTVTVPQETGPGPAHTGQDPTHTGQDPTHTGQDPAHTGQEG